MSNSFGWLVAIFNVDYLEHFFFRVCLSKRKAYKFLISSVAHKHLFILEIFALDAVSRNAHWPDIKLKCILHWCDPMKCTHPSICGQVKSNIRNYWINFAQNLWYSTVEFPPIEEVTIFPWTFFHINSFPCFHFDILKMILLLCFFYMIFISVYCCRWDWGKSLHFR